MAAATVNTADLLQTLSARGKRYELIHGDLIEMSPAGFEPVSYTHLTLPTNREV